MPHNAPYKMFVCMYGHNTPLSGHNSAMLVQQSFQIHLLFLHAILDEVAYPQMGMFQNCRNHVGRNLIQTMAANFVINALPNC